MSAVLARLPLLRRFFGSSISTASGVAIGGAVQRSLDPYTQSLANSRWKDHAVVPPDVYLLAIGVAQGQIGEGVAKTWAAEQGFGDDQWKAIRAAADVGPGVAEAYRLRRRGILSDTAFRRALRREGLEDEWISALADATRVFLTPGEAANARQQTWITQAEQYAIAEKHGLTNEDAEIQFLTVGLPPGIETALVMLRRKIIDVGQFAEIVATSHTKTKWTDELLALQTPILSATEWATLHLKGHATVAEMNAGGAQSGYTAQQMNLLYLGMGRPAAPGQLHTAATRGIDGPAGRPVDFAQFETAIAQSDIRPEYARMLWDIRYLYPSLFQLTRLVTSGQITAATGAEWARKARYAPEVVDALLASWGGGGTAGKDSHVAKAQTQLWNRAHTSYLAAEIAEDETRAALPAAGVAAAAVDDVLALWNHERELERKQLTPAQVKKAFTKGVENPATGTPWTKDEATAALVARGYSTADATTFLEL